MDELAEKKVGEVWLNPGADGPEVVERARQLGLKAIQACSIIGIGESPGRLLSQAPGHTLAVTVACSKTMRSLSGDHAGYLT